MTAMASRRLLAVSAIAGVALGAGAMAAIGVFADDEEPVVATTSTTVAAATEIWISEHETRLGPAALVPTSLEVEDGGLVFRYDMTAVTPGGLAEGTVNNGGLSAPWRFTMAWDGGEVTAEVQAPNYRSVRFTVPEGFTVESVRSITVDAYWVAAPSRIPAVFDPSGDAWTELAPGVVARITTILDQPRNVIVKVEYGGEPGRAHDFFVAGDEREWARISNSMIGQSVWTLDFRGDSLPDPLVLNAIGVVWVEVEGGGPVDLGGLLS